MKHHETNPVFFCEAGRAIFPPKIPLPAMEVTSVFLSPRFIRGFRVGNSIGFTKESPNIMGIFHPLELRALIDLPFRELTYPTLGKGKSLHT